MIRPVSQEAVVLLHGLCANRFVMSRLARFLRSDGFDTANWGYRSTADTIEQHAILFLERLDQLVTRGSYDRIHLVTHSMGGIVARSALNFQIPPNIGRFVMLGPPNSGSHVARVLAPRLGRFCRPLDELSDAPDSYVNRLGEPKDVDLGIVAAAADRVVKLESTFLSRQLDHIVLPGHHGALPWRRETAEQVIHFLRHGRFQRGRRIRLEGATPHSQCRNGTLDVHYKNQ